MMTQNKCNMYETVSSWFWVAFYSTCSFMACYWKLVMIICRYCLWAHIDWFFFANQENFLLFDFVWCYQGQLCLIISFTPNQTRENLQITLLVTTYVQAVINMSILRQSPSRLGKRTHVVFVNFGCILQLCHTSGNMHVFSLYTW